MHIVIAGIPLTRVRQKAFNHAMNFPFRLLDDTDAEHVLRTIEEWARETVQEKEAEHAATPHD